MSVWRRCAQRPCGGSCVTGLEVKSDESGGGARDARISVGEQVARAARPSSKGPDQVLDVPMGRDDAAEYGLSDVVHQDAAVVLGHDLMWTRGLEFRLDDGNHARWTQPSDLTGDLEQAGDIDV